MDADCIWNAALVLEDVGKLLLAILNSPSQGVSAAALVKQRLAITNALRGHKWELSKIESLLNSLSRESPLFADSNALQRDAQRDAGREGLSLMALQI